MNQQFYQHQPVQTVDIPQADDQIRIWLHGENEQVKPQIIEGKVHSVSCFDDGSLQSILIWTSQGLQSIHWTIIGSIELA